MPDDMDKQNIKIVFNTSKDIEVASARIFFYNVYRKLKERKFRVSLNDWNNYEDFDIAILYGPDHELRKAKRMNPKLIVGISKLTDGAKEDLYQLRNADFLIAETNLQRDYYLKYNKNIVIVPHAEDIPIELFKKNHINKEKVILGYHGNKVHLKESIACGMNNALEELHNKYRIELLAIYDIRRLGRWKKNVPRIPIIHKQFRIDSIYHDLLNCDIGLCPSLTPISQQNEYSLRWPFYYFRNMLKKSKVFEEYGYDNDFIIRYKNCSNSGRAFVFMFLGIPVVAEPIPTNCEIITNGFNGFVVHTKEGWYDALEKLILDNKLREKISQNAKKFIQDNGYTIDAMVDKFIESVSSIVG